MKMSTQFTIWFLVFNAVSGIMIGMGVADDLGLSVQTGQQEQITAAGDTDAINVTNNPDSNTLIGLRTSLAQQVTTIFLAVLPGMRMLQLFIPDPFVTFLLAPLASLIVVKDVIAFLRGTDL